MSSITKNCVADIITGSIYCGIWGDMKSVSNIMKLFSIREETKNNNYVIMPIKEANMKKISYFDEPDPDYDADCDNSWDYDPGPDCEPDPITEEEQAWIAVFNYEKELGR